MAAPSMEGMVVELHNDLSRNYNMHASRLRSIWRTFDKRKRTECFKAGVLDGVVLKHPLDQSLGNVYMIVPELNLRDITDPTSDFLLDLLHYRATTSPFQQYCEGPNDSEGDHQFIERMMRTEGLRYIEPLPHCYTLFMEGEPYARSFQIDRERLAEAAPLLPAIRAGLMIPQSTARLVLERQINLFQSLCIIISDILDLGSTSRDRKPRSKKSDKAAAQAFSQLTLKSTPAKPELPQVLALALDQKADSEDFLALLATEPAVLNHEVNIRFYSQPELVVDEKGRMLPFHTDRHISACVFEVIHSAIQTAATWNYICDLLELVKDSKSDGPCRTIALQELSNVCHLEFKHKQTAFKRHVQSQNGTGSKQFKRVSNALDEFGNARVAMKSKAEEFTVSNPQLHYTLRICHPDRTVFEAVGWMKKLSDLHRDHPREQEDMAGGEAESLGNLALIVAFTEDLSQVVALPPFSRKTGQAFVSRRYALEKELNNIRREVDLLRFVVPLDNLLEPGVANEALAALHKFVIDKTGTKIGLLYQDMVEDCVSVIQEKQKAVSTKENRPPMSQVGSVPIQSDWERVKWRKEKEKTRPAHKSIYDLPPTADILPVEQPSVPEQKIKVSSAMDDVFATLFDKSLSRGSLSWVGFEGALAELGFSIEPKLGSVYTFYPPDTMDVKRPITLHRPHNGSIEGYTIPIFARRLKRVYGWGEGTFEVL